MKASGRTSVVAGIATLMATACPIASTRVLTIRTASNSPAASRYDGADSSAPFFLRGVLLRLVRQRARAGRRPHPAIGHRFPLHPAPRRLDEDPLRARLGELAPGRVEVMPVT